MSEISKLAEICSGAEIAENVKVGSFTRIGPNVKIGKGCVIHNNVNIEGYTEIGENNQIFPFASLGSAPHDLGYKGERSYLVVGSNNVFREGFTANVGAAPESTTKVGNNCFFMANSHIGHNCHLGNRIILANGALLGGHVEMADNCFIGGNSALHQFVRVGRFVIMGGVSASSIDIPPFMVADGRNQPVRSINLIGLKRNGFTPEQIIRIKNVYKIFFKSDLNINNAIDKIKADIPQTPEVIEFITFVEGRTHRGICTGKTHAR